MEKKVIDVLMKMGMPANIKGFKYIVDAIRIFEEDGNCTTVDLYNRIAELNKDTYTRVERAIRHAFSIVRRDKENELYKKYLSCENETNGNLLATLYYRLKTEVE